MADSYAKHALATHARPDKARRQEVAKQLDDATPTLRLAAALLPMWPRIGREEIRAAKLEPRLVRSRAAAVQLSDAHAWERSGENWQCANCYAVALSAASVGKRRLESCAGKHDNTRRVLENVGGHQLALADVGGGPCFACLACGAWGTTQPRGLLRACKGAAARTSGGRQALRSFAKGELPETVNPKKRGNRGPAPRKKVQAWWDDKSGKTFRRPEL